MLWSYGVTVVPERFHTSLPATLNSLKEAGFPQPVIFVDGCKDSGYGGDIPPHIRDFYEVVCRPKRLRAFGNWVLSAWELYLREPHADRYAIFQDDFVTYKNLRAYLEKVPYPNQGYLNLYTFPKNVSDLKGWYKSPDQDGKGAVALVFDNDALRYLLQQKHFIDRPLDSKRGHRAVDGGIVTAFQSATPKYFEYVHNPSLVQHIGTLEKGIASAVGNKQHDLANTFLGEEFDAMNLLESAKPIEVKSEVVQEKRRTKRIGLVGFNCRSGLGELNRQIATYCQVDKWLVKPHDKYPTLPDHEDVDTWHCPTGAKVEEFVRSVDTILFCETPYYHNLIEAAKKFNKRLVCVPMQEWMPSGLNGWPMEVDLFICPTKHSYDQFAHVVPCVHFPWPVDTERFQFKLRTECKRFLFLNGHGGYNGRKGAEVVRDALALWPEMPLVVKSQREENWPSGVQFFSEVPDNGNLYDMGDVLLCPHHVDGLGLEPMEAMACGMPVITTDGKPWNELPACARIPATIEKRKVRRPVDWYCIDPQKLVKVCQAVLKGSMFMEEESIRAGDWAKANSWRDQSGVFTAIVRYGETQLKESVA